MGNKVDHTIKRTGESRQFMLALVLLLSGTSIAIACLTAPFAVGRENFSEGGQLAFSIFSWGAGIELAMGVYLLFRARSKNA